MILSWVTPCYHAGRDCGKVGTVHHVLVLPCNVSFFSLFIFFGCWKVRTWHSSNQTCPCCPGQVACERFQDLFHVSCAMAALQPQSNAALPCGLLPCTSSASAHPSPRDRLGKGPFVLPICPFQILPIELGPGPFQDPIERGVPQGRRSSRSTIDEVHQVQLARTFLAGRRVLSVE